MPPSARPTERAASAFGTTGAAPVALGMRVSLRPAEMDVQPALHLERQPDQGLTNDARGDPGLEVSALGHFETLLRADRGVDVVHEVAHPHPLAERHYIPVRNRVPGQQMIRARIGEMADVLGIDLRHHIPSSVLGIELDSPSVPSPPVRIVEERPPNAAAASICRFLAATASAPAAAEVVAVGGGGAGAPTVALLGFGPSNDDAAAPTTTAESTAAVTPMSSLLAVQPLRATVIGEFVAQLLKEHTFPPRRLHMLIEHLHPLRTQGVLRKPHQLGPKAAGPEVGAQKQDILEALEARLIVQVVMHKDHAVADELPCDPGRVAAHPAGVLDAVVAVDVRLKGDVRIVRDLLLVCDQQGCDLSPQRVGAFPLKDRLRRHVSHQRPSPAGSARHP